MIIVIFHFLGCESKIDQILKKDSDIECTSIQITDAEEIYRKAESLYRKERNVQGAQKQFLNAILKCPKSKYYFELGNSYIDTEQYDFALRVFEKGREIGHLEEQSLSFYNSACAAALANRKKKALIYLERAFNNGYSNFQHVKHDKDLKNIRNEPDFLKLIQKYEALNKMSDLGKYILGEWQIDSPMWAAGNGDMYYFLSDGTYAYTTSQMSCDRELYAISGQWQLSGNKLHLNSLSKEIFVGGEIVKSTGSCGSDYERVGGHLESQKIDPPKEETLEIQVRPHMNADYRPHGQCMFVLGAHKLWKNGDCWH